MKGKSMSQKKLLKRFLSIQALYSELCESYCEKKQRSIYWMKMSKLMNAIFCSQPHIQLLLFHWHTNKTALKNISNNNNNNKFRPHSCFLSMLQFISDCAAVWPNLTTTEWETHNLSTFSSVSNPRTHLDLLLSLSLYRDMLSGWWHDKRPGINNHLYHLCSACIMIRS